MSRENVDLVLLAMDRLGESYRNGAASDGLLDLCDGHPRRCEPRVSTPLSMTAVKVSGARSRMS